MYGMRIVNDVSELRYQELLENFTARPRDRRENLSTDRMGIDRMQHRRRMTGGPAAEEFRKEWNAYRDANDQNFEPR